MVISSVKALFSKRLTGFDPEFYAGYYPDLSALKSPSARLRHFLKSGLAEGRFRNEAEAIASVEAKHGPLPADFSVDGYRASNVDLAAAFTHRAQFILHYLQYGRAERRRYDGAPGDADAAYHFTYELTKPDGVVPSRRPRNENDFALETPFRYATVANTERVAAIIHVFYPDLLPAVIEKLANIPAGVDLFLSTDSEAKQAEIRRHTAGWVKGSIDIRVMPNRGRDIAPKIVGFADVYARYDIFLHLHTKKSPHGGDPLAGWRDYLIDTLIGSPEIATSNLALFNDPRMGVVFPQHMFDLRGVLNWGFDYETARRLMKRIGVTIDKNHLLEFPSGSMFWGRSAAIRPLLDLRLSVEDFPEESGQIDGTLAHAIERSLLTISEFAGFEWLKVARRGVYPLAETILAVEAPQDIARHRLKVFQPTLARVDGSLRPKALGIVDTRPILSYPSRNERPRVNLIVPTINPRQSFGGIASALKFFEALADALGEGYDRRIVVTDAVIEPEGYALYPDYVSAPNEPGLDEDRRIVVDAFDRMKKGGRIDLRAGDIFVATAWWTAGFAVDLEKEQRLFFGGERPFVYLIQDDEPYFYGRSSKSALAEATYRHGERTLAVINSQELYDVFRSTYRFRESFCLPYAINEKISARLEPVPRERRILVYGRPSVPRNNFELICDGLFQWQQRDPIRASRWEIVFLGEDFDPAWHDPVQNATVGGKVTLDEYADHLNRAAIGVSLMMSPHPSYPPLEMAEAGLLTITNRFENKDLRRRFPEIVSLERLDADALADALEDAIDRMEPRIGEIVPRRASVETPVPKKARFEVGRLAAIIDHDIRTKVSLGGKVAPSTPTPPEYESFFPMAVQPLLRVFSGWLGGLKGAVRAKQWSLLS